MGATVTPVQGYLAGIFRTPDILVGAARREQLLLNSGFDSEDLTSWTDDSAGGTSSATATAAKGWMERSWGCVLNDDGANLAGIHQDVTLDTALTATQALSYRIIASVWGRFDAIDDEATLKVTGTLNTGAVATVTATPTAGGTGYTVNDILTISTGSGDATVTATAVVGEAVTEITFLAAGTSGYAVGAGNAVTGGTGNDDCTVAIATITATTSVGSVTMVSAPTFYDDGVTLYGFDGYYSIGIDALENMVDIKVEVYSNAGAAQVVNIDNVRAYIVDEIAGAYGDLALDQNTLLENITTYATIGSHGEHSFGAASEEPQVLEIPAFYITGETFAVDMQDGDRVFVILYTKRGTKTSHRWEFFAYVKGVGITVPGRSFIKENVSLQLTGIVGFADR